MFIPTIKHLFPFRYKLQNQCKSEKFPTLENKRSQNTLNKLTSKIYHPRSIAIMFLLKIPSSVIRPDRLANHSD